MNLCLVVIRSDDAYDLAVVVEPAELFVTNAPGLLPAIDEAELGKGSVSTQLLLQWDFSSATLDRRTVAVSGPAPV